MKIFYTLVIALLLNFSLAQVSLLGAGATFPAPLITSMADEYRDLTGITVNYQSIGSGGGIRQFLEQTITFGMTEAFLKDEALAEVYAATGGTAFNIPITLGDVVATYNLPGVGTGLVFSGEVLADLFLGNITNWGDERIAALNPGVRLPPLPVTIVHRSDGSGTTAIFTDYLSKVSDEWSEKVGFATSVSWPKGIGGNGNEGVAGVVQNTPGSLGYNSLVYAVLNDISYASMVNLSGNVISPSLEATTISADVEISPDTRVSITNTEAEFGYPITGFAWMLVYEKLEQNRAIVGREEALELIRFVVWTITDGQNLSEGLSFARIPPAVTELSLAMIRQITWEGEALGALVLEE